MRDPAGVVAVSYLSLLWVHNTIHIHSLYLEARELDARRPRASHAPHGFCFMLLQRRSILDMRPTQHARISREHRSRRYILSELRPLPRGVHQSGVFPEYESSKVPCPISSMARRRVVLEREVNLRGSTKG